MATVGARLLADRLASPGQIGTPWFGETTAALKFYEGLRSPPDQISTAVWLSWDWAELPDDVMASTVLWPVVAWMIEAITADNLVPAPGSLYLPEGIPDAAGVEFDNIAFRVIVMEHPTPGRMPGERRKRWYNAHADEFEDREVLPLARFDVRVRKEGE